MNWLKYLIATITAVIMGLFTMVIISFISAIPVLFLWNWLMPLIFGITKLTFIQTWGITFLTGILFRMSSVVKPEKRK